MAESRRDEIAKLEALYASNPDGRVFTHLAEAYRRAGDLDRARDILDRGLQRHPDYPSAHVVLGRVYADLGRDEDAAASFHRVLELDPENLIARRSLAEAARAAGRDEDALLHYRELLEQDPSAFEVKEIVSELEGRLHGPPAPPPLATPSWSTSRDEQSWDAPAPMPGGDEGRGGFGEAAPPEPTAFGDIDLGGTFGEATSEPSEPAPSPFDPAPLDLSGIDFGGAGAAPPAAEAGERPGADDSYDATGWGEWPAEPEATSSPQDEEEETDLQVAGGLEGDLPALEPPETPATGEDEVGRGAVDALESPAADVAGDEPAVVEPAYTGEPEPFSGRPTVEAPLESAAEPAPEPAAETAPEPVAETAAEPATETAAEPARGTAAEPVAETAPDLAAAESDAPHAETEQPAEPAAGPAQGAGRTPESDAGLDDFGVPTETLATLYEAQGFPDRAAAVYRALLRDRPGDERLRERARAADEAAAALRAERTGIEETREVWLSGTSESGVGPRTAYAWEDDEEDDEPAGAGPSIAEYLQRVLSWHPAGGESRAVEAPEATPEVDSASVDDTVDAAPPDDTPQPWKTADITAPGPDEPLQPWDTAEPEAPSRDEVLEPWEARAEADESGELDTIDGFVFGAEPAEPPDAAPPAESRAEIEYGYGLAPGGSTFGAHPPEEPPAASDVAPETGPPEEAPGGADEAGAAEPFVFGAAPQPEADQPFNARSTDSGLHLDTLLPLPPEDEVVGEQPATWFEPAASHDPPAAHDPLPFEIEEPPAPIAEPLPFEFEETGAAADASVGEPLPFGFDEPAPDRAEPLPFQLDEPDAGADETVAEPLPFDFEQIGTDPGVPAAEPLPFDLAALGADVDDEPGEPLPFEVADSDVDPWVPQDAFSTETGSQAAPEDAMLELEEAEAVNESTEPAADGWDPTIALADVASAPYARPEPKLRVEGGRPRPEPRPDERSVPQEDEEEQDEDLEMFRAWLQSLKR